MSIPARAVAPEAVEEARRLYETTRVPVQQVADLLGISKSTLNRRAREWGWHSRAERIPIVTPPGRPVDGAPAAPPLVPRGELVARLVARIEGEIAAVERIIAHAGLATGAQAASDAERAARTLGLLVKSLRELAAIERAEAQAEAEETEEDDSVRDVAAYRRELAAALERVLAGRPAG